MTLHKDLREFIESLNSHGVEFVVVGAHAVAFHGHPRFTGDRQGRSEGWASAFSATSRC